MHALKCRNRVLWLQNLDNLDIKLSMVGAGGTVVVQPLFYKQEDVNSIPSDLIEFLNLPHPSRSTMDLGSIQPLKEMSTKDLNGGRVWPAPKADNLTAIYESTVWKTWDIQCLTTL
jgi:hypothetical protein